MKANISKFDEQTSATKKLLEYAEANEYAEQLASMLAVYVQHAEIEKLSMSNAVSLTVELISFFRIIEGQTESNKVNSNLLI